jgi:hypothetical protein
MARRGDPILEDGGDMFLRNMASANHTALQTQETAPFISIAVRMSK